MLDSRYWDWAENAHLPEACLQRQILVFAGSTKLEQLIRNPLFSYSYTSEMAKDLVNTQLITPSLWTESKRCPDADGNQHPEVSDVSFSAVAKMGYNLMLVLHSYKISQKKISRAIPGSFLSQQLTSPDAALASFS